MTKNELYVYIAAILTTLADVDGTPESMLYILIDMDMDKYQTVRNVLVQMKWVSISGNYVKITPNGRKIAVEMSRVLAK